MPAAQTQKHIAVARSLSFKTYAQPPAIIRAYNLSLNCCEARRNIAFLAPSQDYLHRFALLPSDDCCHTRTNDGRFLFRNLCDRVAQVFLMIQRDWSDGDRPGVRGCRRVQSSAQTRFEDCQSV